MRIADPAPWFGGRTTGYPAPLPSQAVEVKPVRHPNRLEWQPRFVPLLLLLLALAAAPLACKPAGDAAPEPAADAWRDFTGSWTAAGARRVLALAGSRSASVIDVSGTMILSGPQRPAVGFRAEAVALTDSATGLVGRAVFTDENGDRVFSELWGGGEEGDDRVHGRVVGGTGRFAGLEGEYSFRWQYLLEGEDGRIQGRAVELAGRVRRAAAAATRGTP